MDAGEYTIYVKGTNPNYQGEATTTAKLTIKKRPVTFTGETATKEYTGSEIELTGVTPSEGEDEGLVSGHTDNVSYSAKGTEVGEYDGEITAKADVVIMAGETNVTANYEITTTPGKLTIEATDEEFEISLEDDEYVYDAAEHYNAKTAESTATTGTTTFSYSFEENGTYVSDLSSLTKVDAGEYTIYVKGTNPNYQGEATTTAKLTITQRDVTFTATSEEKEYTGSEITINGLTVSEGEDEGLVDGHTHNVEFSASGTEVGEYTGTITEVLSVVIMSGTTDVTANYNITVVNGKLTITATDE